MKIMGHVDVHVAISLCPLIWSRNDVCSRPNLEERLCWCDPNLLGIMHQAHLTVLWYRTLGNVPDA